jgi:hypothetical protein
MKYTEFAEWASDVKYYFPDAELNTDVNEYWVGDRDSTVAYWKRDVKVGYISIQDSTV